jgi:hypothetical protein
MFGFRRKRLDGAAIERISAFMRDLTEQGS